MSIFAQLPLIVSYYTKNTPYEQEVQTLIKSCDQFGIEYSIDAIESFGSWEENCAFKPFFLRKKLETLQRPILWVDADAVFLRPMEFEEFMFADLSLLKDSGTDPRFSVRSGTVYINSTEKGLEALKLWCSYSEKIWEMEKKVLPFQDQASLYFTLLSKPPISISLLPLKYCAIFDEELKDLAKEEVVIEQRQASRRFHSKKE
jgi:hypothetical protein